MGPTVLREVFSNSIPVLRSLARPGLMQRGATSSGDVPLGNSIEDLLGLGLVNWLGADDGVKKRPKAEAEDIEAALKIRRSPAFEQAFRAEIDKAKAHILSLSPEQRKNGAVVLDIDETIADSSDYYETKEYREKRAFNQEDCNNWMNGILTGKRKAKPMPGMVEFAKWLHQQGIPVYFVTGRGENLRKATEVELAQLGLEPSEIAGLVLKPEAKDGEPRVPTYQYKQSARQQIERETGRTILASLGDQKSDIWGKSKGQGFLLPKPIYDFTRIEPLPDAEATQTFNLNRMRTTWMEDALAA